MFLENIIGNNLYFLVTRNLSDENDDEEKDSDPIITKSSEDLVDKNLGLVRSKTMPPSTLAATGNKRMKENSNLKQVSSTNIITDRLKLAKEEAERAIKVRPGVFEQCLCITALNVTFLQTE